MITPLGWLERVPTYKDQQEQLKEQGPGHLRLPRLPAAAERRHPAVPAGLRAGGRGSGRACGGHARDSRAASTISTAASRISSRRPSAPSRSSADATSRCTDSCVGASRRPAIRRRSSARARWWRAIRASPWPIANGCSGYLEGTSVSILPEPQVLLTATPRVPGLDGRKMSKSYGNTIRLREDPDSGRCEAQDHADRSGARAAHRSGRSGEMSGVGSAQAVFGSSNAAVGQRGLPHAPASVVWIARSR